MFATLQTSSKPSLDGGGNLLSDLVWLPLNPGETVESDITTFIAHPASPKHPYRALKLRHDGSYYIGRKLAASSAFIAPIFIGLIGIGFGISNVDWAPSIDWSSFVTNMMSFAIVAASSWYVITPLRRLASLMEVLYADLRTMFARVDANTIRQADVEKYWPVFQVSLADQVQKLDTAPNGGALLQLTAMTERLEAMSDGDFDQDIEGLKIEIGFLTTRAITPRQAQELLDGQLQQGETSLLGMNCKSAVSGFFIGVKQLDDEKQDAFDDQIAAVDASIRRLADKETMKLALALVTELNEQRISRIKEFMADVTDEIRRRDDKDARITSLSESIDF